MREATCLRQALDPRTRTVAVRAPARLHLGLFPLTDGFGTLGVALREPGLSLTAAPAPDLAGSGPDSGRALAAARRVQQAWGVATGARITVRAAVPAHVGLGSGTQLALATGLALSRLWGVEAPVEEIAAATGRVGRSRVGLEVFRAGGLVVHAELGGGPPQTVRYPLRADWAFVVVTPLGGTGLHGNGEELAFAGLPAMPPGMRKQIHRVLDRDLLPGLAQADPVQFGTALTRIQHMVGDWFAPRQGGRYAHPAAEAVLAAMVGAGAVGTGQSSWGPTIYGLTRGEESSRRAAGAAEAACREAGIAANILVSGSDALGARWWWESCG